MTENQPLMTDERMAKIRLLAKNDLLLEELLTETLRLQAALIEVSERTCDCGCGYVADAALHPKLPTCDGCGGLATSMVDADGNHLCRECGLTIMEDVS